MVVDVVLPVRQYVFFFFLAGAIFDHALAFMSLSSTNISVQYHLSKRSVRGHILYFDTSKEI